MSETSQIEQFEVRNRWTNAVQFTAEIEVTPDMLPRVKLGLAIRWARKNSADLSDADLSDAYLRGAYLRGAYLRGAYLRGANLSDADLSGANLRDAYLRGAGLSGAYLRGADLSGANLRDAYLRGAYLRDADLSGANLRDAYLRGAYLRDADLSGAKDIKLPHFQIPQEGELIVWKKLAGGAICKLRIPPEAKRTASVIGRKCRAEYAEVLEGEGTSWRGAYNDLEYAPGKIVRPDSYDDNPLVECSNGIHFFLTREEAEEW